MAYRYDTLLKAERTAHAPSKLPDTVQQSPAAVVAVWPFKKKNTFDFDKARSKGNTATVYELDDGDVRSAANPHKHVNLDTTYKQVDGPFEIQDRCLDLTVSRAKGNPTGRLSLTMVDPDQFAIRNLAPGDWIACWLFDNRADAKRVSDDLRAGKACNDFDRAPKFLGKVESVRQTIQITPDGLTVKRVNLTAVSFSELQAKLYFNPGLLINDPEAMTWLGQLIPGQDINDILTNPDPKAVSIQSMIQLLLGSLYGVGIGEGAKEGPSEEIKRSPNEAYLLPAPVARVFGIAEPQNDAVGPKFSDLIRVYLGIQNYNHSRLGFHILPVPDPSVYGWVADRNWYDWNVERSPLVLMDSPIIGRFNPQALPWTNAPVWGILQGYLPSQIDEMFTTMRVGYDNKIYPSLVIRQIPFTTDRYQGGLPATPFSTLPRWIVHPIQVLALDIGRSESLRCNFVHVIPLPPTEGVQDYNRAQAEAENLPVADASDIKRNGLQSYIGNINLNSFTENQDLPKMQDGLGRHWNLLISDWMMGGHLKYNGTIITKGIQAPVPLGDNLEYDGLLFHIEAIQDRFTVNENGLRSFITTFQLSNGVSAKHEAQQALDSADHFADVDGQNQHDYPPKGEINPDG